MVITIILAIVAIWLVYKIVPLIFAVRGGNSYQEGDIEKALKNYKTAATIFGGDAKSKGVYVAILMRAGKFNEAEQVLNEMIFDERTKLQDKITAKSYRCMLYQKTGRLDEAMEEAEELFQKVKNTQTYGMLGYLKLLKGDNDLEFYLEAYDYNSDDRDICDNLVMAYIRNGELEKAEALAESLREGYPTFVEAFYHSAIVAKMRGDKENALSYLEAIESCNRNIMTTVSEKDIAILKEEIENA